MQEDQDRELLRRFVQGDQDAFETLFRQSEAEVYRWIVRIVRDTSSAEDVLIEAFWRAYRGRARFDPSRSFGAWMRRIATNAACDHLRTLRRSRWFDQSSGDEIKTPATRDAGLNDTISFAFRKLPPDMQVVATLALVEGRPYTEIADVLGLRVGTVKSRLSRAVGKLRKELARHGIES